MKQKELNLLLVDNFPSLKYTYQKETEWQEGDETGSHVVYGDVFVPYIRENLIKNNYIELKKIFDFIENLLHIEDTYVEDVISCSVIESIYDLLNDNRQVLELLGEKTKSILSGFKDYFM